MVEIVVDNGQNGDLLFHPAAERVRGAVDVSRVQLPELGTLPRDFPKGIPGQTIAFDPATNTGSIREPLLTAEHATVRATIEKTIPGADFGVAERSYPNAHAGTWLGHMRRAVEAGLAKLVKGKLPEADPPDMRKGFYTPEPKADPKDATITQLVALLASKLSPAERKEMAALLGGAASGEKK